jgi:hypothetical protein
LKAAPHGVKRPGRVRLRPEGDERFILSADPIESAANSGLLALFDTGGVFIAAIKSRQDDR